MAFNPLLTPRRTSEERMRFFDALPMPVRRAIAGATFGYAPEATADRIERGERPAAIVREIVKLDARRLSRIRNRREVRS